MDDSTSRRAAARRTVVVVGAGFAGAYAAQALERKLPPDDDLVVLDRNNYFVFYPLLVEAGTGTVHPRDAVIGVRDFVRRGTFVMGDVQAIDLAARTVTYRVPEQEPRTLAYDHLVLAPGSVTRLPPVPGLAEYGWQMKSIADAVSLRDRAIQLLETASATEDERLRRALLHFVVVGANFTGVELAGEYFAFLRDAARRYPRLDPAWCRLTLVEMTGRILSAVGGDLGLYALKQMRRRGMDVLLETQVQEIRPHDVVLSNGTTLPSATVIWCAGVAPSPLLDLVHGLPRDAKGYVPVLPDLRVVGQDRVWAVGDTAAARDPHGELYAQTAQNALQEGRHVAANVARALANRPTEPFRYAGRGSLAALGCRTAVAEVFGLRLSGFVAWFMWRTVYLMKMPGLSRKARLALDWTIQLLFRRDYVQLGVHRDTTRALERGPVGQRRVS